MINSKSLFWYLALAFIPAWILFTLPIAFGPAGSSSRQMASTICWAAAMWAPGVAALITNKFIKRQPFSALHLNRLGEKRAYLWAWLLPLFLVIITGLLTWLFGLGKLDLEFTLIRKAMAQAPGGQAIDPVMVVAIQAIFAMTLAPLLNIIFALGEELGWRGFLLPELLPLGQWKAILLSGTIWGIWHAPAILQGHNYPSQPVLGVFMMLVFCVLAGTLLSWVYLRTASPWAPALGHGSINAIAGLPVLFLTGMDITYSGTLASPVAWIPLALFVAWLALTRRLPVIEPAIEDTRAHANSSEPISVQEA